MSWAGCLGQRQRFSCFPHLFPRYMAFPIRLARRHEPKELCLWGLFPKPLVKTLRIYEELIILEQLSG